MILYDCPTCGRGGWTCYEIVNGECPSCREEEPDEIEEDGLNEIYTNNV